ncbi:MAG: dephospho-CoA kinase [Chitinophagales bacterium]|nr:dephospho-CoA kinase [Hyphomicrobiales bacterium]
MLVVGLTGSIGMGKTTAASHLRERGFPVFDSDAAVHSLYAREAVAPVEKAFPGVTLGGVVDREKLSAALQLHTDGLDKLEAIVHPLVRQAQYRFLKELSLLDTEIAVLDIPLLFETAAETLVDVIIVMSAPSSIQEARVLARPGMTREKFAALSSRQTPDAKKRELADFVVNTGGEIDETRARLDEIMADLKGRFGSAFARWRTIIGND